MSTKLSSSSDARRASGPDTTTTTTTTYGSNDNHSPADVSNKIYSDTGNAMSAEDEYGTENNSYNNGYEDDEDNEQDEDEEDGTNDTNNSNTAATSSSVGLGNNDGSVTRFRHDRLGSLASQNRPKGSVFNQLNNNKDAGGKESKRRPSLMYMEDKTLRNLQVEGIIKQRRMEISLTKLVQFDPQRRKAKDNLARYFQRWALALPLYQKCDELGLQLRERNRALQSVREAYVKDVLSVKMKMEEVLKQLGSPDDSITTLDALPSVDLRGMMKDFLVKDVAELVKRNPYDLVTSEAFPRPNTPSLTSAISNTRDGGLANRSTSTSTSIGATSVLIPGVNTHMALDKTLVPSDTGYPFGNTTNTTTTTSTSTCIDDHDNNHSVPSAFRGGKSAPKASASSQLQHMFVHKLTKQYTEAQKLPWEHSPNYELYKSFEKGFEYKLPKNTKQGAVIDVHAPKNFKLLVRYCSDCVGFMGLVHEWNDVVETSLERSIEKRDETLFRDAIMRLNETIYNQSHEILTLETKLKSVERSTKWLNDKATEADQKDTIFKLSEKLNIMQNFAGMCLEDRDAMQMFLQDRYLGTIEAKEIRICELQEVIEKRDKTIQSLQNKINDHHLHIASYDTRIAQMNEDRDGLCKNIFELTEKLDEKSALAAELLRGLNAKDEYIMTMKKSNSNKVAEAKAKYRKLNEEYIVLETDWKDLNARFDTLLDDSSKNIRNLEAQASKAKEQHSLAMSYQLSRISMSYEDQLSRLSGKSAVVIQELLNRPPTVVVEQVVADNRNASNSNTITCSTNGFEPRRVIATSTSAIMNQDDDRTVSTVSLSQPTETAAEAVRKKISMIRKKVSSRKPTSTSSSSSSSSKGGGKRGMPKSVSMPIEPSHHTLMDELEHASLHSVDRRSFDDADDSHVTPEISIDGGTSTSANTTSGIGIDVTRTNLQHIATNGNLETQSIGSIDNFNIDIVRDDGINNNINTTTTNVITNIASNPTTSTSCNDRPSDKDANNVPSVVINEPIVSQESNADANKAEIGANVDTTTDIVDSNKEELQLNSNKEAVESNEASASSSSDIPIEAISTSDPTPTENGTTNADNANDEGVKTEVVVAVDVVAVVEVVDQPKQENSDATDPPVEIAIDKNTTTATTDAADVTDDDGNIADPLAVAPTSNTSNTDAIAIATTIAEVVNNDNFVIPDGLEPEDFTTGGGELKKPSSSPKDTTIDDVDVDVVVDVVTEPTTTTAAAAAAADNVATTEHSTINDLAPSVTTTNGDAAIEESNKHPTTTANTTAINTTNGANKSRATSRTPSLSGPEKEVELEEIQDNHSYVSELSLEHSPRANQPNNSSNATAHRGIATSTTATTKHAPSRVSSSGGVGEAAFDDADADDDIDFDQEEDDDNDVINPEALKKLEAIEGEVEIAAWDFMNISKLRIAIWRVRFLIRLRKGITERRFDLLGAYGLRLQTLCLNRELKRTKLNNEDMNQRLVKLEQVVNDNEARAIVTAKAHEDKLEALDLSMAIVKQSSEDMKHRLEAALAVARRDRMLCKAQRGFAKMLADTLTIVRARIYMMLHCDSLKNSVPLNMIEPPKKVPKAVATIVPAPVVVSPPPVAQRSKRAASSFGTKAYAKEMDEVREQYKQKKEQEAKALEAAKNAIQEPENITDAPLYKTRKWFFHLLTRLRKIHLERPCKPSSAGISGSSNVNALKSFLLSEDATMNVFIRGVGSDMDKLEHFVSLMRQENHAKGDQISAFKQFLNIPEPKALPDSKGMDVSSRLALLMNDSDVEDVNTHIVSELDIESIRMLATARCAPEVSQLQQFQKLISDPDVAKLDILTLAAVTNKPSQSTSNSNSTITNNKLHSNKAHSGAFNRRGALSMPAGFIPQPMVKAYENAYVASERSLNRQIADGKQRIIALEDEVTDYVQIKARLEADLDIMVDDYDFLQRQNKTLKTALEDSYRVHQKMTADELIQRGLDAQHKQSVMRSKSTQVACVSCDLELANVSDTGVHVHKASRAMHTTTTTNTQVSHSNSASSKSMMPQHDFVPEDAAEPFDSRAKTSVMNRVALSAAPGSPVTAGAKTTAETRVSGVLKEFLDGNPNGAPELKKLMVATRQRPQSARPFEKSSVVEDAFSRSQRVNDIAMSSAATVKLPDLPANQRDTRYMLSQSQSQPHLQGSDRTTKTRPQTAFAKIKSIPQKSSDANSITHSATNNSEVSENIDNTAEALPNNDSYADFSDDTPSVNLIPTALVSNLRKSGAADAQMAASLQILHEIRANDLAIAETYERLREHERIRLLEALTVPEEAPVDANMHIGNKAPRKKGTEPTHLYSTNRSSDSSGTINNASKVIDNLLVQGTPHHPEQLKTMQALKVSTSTGYMQISPNAAALSPQQPFIMSQRSNGSEDHNTSNNALNDGVLGTMQLGGKNV